MKLRYIMSAGGLALLLGILAGCSKPPVITAPTEADFKASYALVAQNLSAEQRTALDAAIEKIIGRATADYLGKVRNPAEARAFALMELDGLNAQEIIAKAQQLDK